MDASPGSSVPLCFKTLPVTILIILEADIRQGKAVRVICAAASFQEHIIVQDTVKGSGIFAGTGRDIIPAVLTSLQRRGASGPRAG